MQILKDIAATFKAARIILFLNGIRERVTNLRWTFKSSATSGLKSYYRTSIDVEVIRTVGEIKNLALLTRTQFEVTFAVHFSDLSPREFSVSGWCVNFRFFHY